MAKLLISPAANDDLISIREYIAKDLDSPKAAANIVVKIIKSIKIFVDFPLSGADEFNKTTLELTEEKLNIRYKKRKRLILISSILIACVTIIIISGFIYHNFKGNNVNHGLAIPVCKGFEGKYYGIKSDTGTGHIGEKIGNFIYEIKGVSKDKSIAVDYANHYQKYDYIIDGSLTYNNILYILRPYYPDNIVYFKHIDKVNAYNLYKLPDVDITLQIVIEVEDGIYFIGEPLLSSVELNGIKYNVQQNLMNISSYEPQKYIGITTPTEEKYKSIETIGYSAYEYDSSRMGSDTIILHINEVFETYAVKS